MRFATVFTPGVDLAKRQAMLEVLRSYFEVRNTDRQRTNNYERGHARSGYKTARTWELQFWFLHGPEDTWGKQLSKKYRRHPVFALISGLAQGSWQPVHEFCERQRLPCWFPTVDAPVVAEDDFYSFWKPIFWHNVSPNNTAREHCNTYCRLVATIPPLRRQPAHSGTHCNGLGGYRWTNGG